MVETGSIGFHVFHKHTWQQLLIQQSLVAAVLNICHQLIAAVFCGLPVARRHLSSKSFRIGYYESCCGQATNCRAFLGLVWRFFATIAKSVTALCTLRGADA